MGSMDRSKKRVQVWKKTVFHFLICFVMGFFIGFAPTSKSSYPIFQPMPQNDQSSMELSPRPLANSSSDNRSLAETPSSKVQETNLSEETETEIEPKLTPRRQVIVVTPTNDRDPLRGLLLRRLATTLKLVPPPLLWIVVESQLESSDVSHILRKTGVMYRHLVFKENFTDLRAETEHQRNLALTHIQHHRLSGIVHFAGLSNVYHLTFFQEIRAIEAMGAWPVAKISARRRKVRIEGPVCEASQVVGWHLKNSKSEVEQQVDLHISGFGFNSSILWDPERWGRPSSTLPTKQNSLKFVKQAVIEDETKLRGVPAEDCSKIYLWQFHLSTRTVALENVPETTTLGAR